MPEIATRDALWRETSMRTGAVSAKNGSLHSAISANNSLQIRRQHYLQTLVVQKHAKTRSYNIHHFEDQGQIYISSYNKLAEICGISHKCHRNNVIKISTQQTYLPCNSVYCRPISLVQTVISSVQSIGPNKSKRLTKVTLSLCHKLQFLKVTNFTEVERLPKV